MNRLTVLFVSLIVTTTSATAACNVGNNRTRIACLNTKVQNLSIKIRHLEVASVPKGAVSAFNTETCPAGWAQFEPARNRVIVGRGEVQALRTEIGGPIKLTAKNIPKLKVNVESDLEKIQTYQKEFFAHFQGQMLVLLEAYQQQGSNDFALSASVGEDSPEEINFMPPAIALTICEKK